MDKKTMQTLINFVEVKCYYFWNFCVCIFNKHQLFRCRAGNWFELRSKLYEFCIYCKMHLHVSLLNP